MDPYLRLKEATKWMWALGDYDASLIREVNGAEDGSLALDSEYICVLARKVSRSS